MLAQIRAALSDIAQSYRDTRIHHCKIKAMTMDGDRCSLSGTVLDKETQATVTRAMVARFPGVTFDAQGIQVLRPGSFVAVETNVTSLHAEPSFGAEMVSQLLNGRVVELLMERESWAYICQDDGYLGWTYRPYLTATSAPDPTHIVCQPVSLLRSAPNTDGLIISRVMVGTAVRVIDALNQPDPATGKPWVRLALAGGPEGWVSLVDLRALDEFPLCQHPVRSDGQDAAARRRQMAQDAFRLTGVPYVWGGCTALGIDCSGMVQLLHRLVGVTIPRDADMQYDAGRVVEPPFQTGDLLFFGGEGDARSITHVGMSLGGWRIVHASRARNGVYKDDVQAVEHLRDSFVGACTFLG